MNRYDFIMTLAAIGLALLVYEKKALKNLIKGNENLKNIQKDPEFAIVGANVVSDGSSVWCTGETNIDRKCKFHHLCYSPLKDDFIFIHGSKSVMSGIPQNRFSPALADMSSVPDHNTQYFNFVDGSVNTVNDFKQIFILKGESFIFNRFNPGNLMHVFHDDLLPLFHSLFEINYGKIYSSDIRLVLFDGHPKLDYFYLYTLLSPYRPLLKDDLNKFRNSLICFEHALFGLSNSTTWYQYGFHKPQGPVYNLEFNSRTINLFTEYFRNQMDVKRISEESSSLQNTLNGIIIGRRTNRLILNQGDLLASLARELGITIQVMYLEDSEVNEIIQKISLADLLIGVHGSALVLSMFLPKGSLLVEIFPYAVNPDHYTPYKTLVSLPQLGIRYLAWRNVNKANTVFHKSAPVEYGGIDHLPLEEQNKILTSSEVPLHLCCNNPEWLFRIYQDTIVDVESFVGEVKEALNKPIPEKEIEPFEYQMYPAQVERGYCKKVNTADDIGLHVVWQPPWNLSYLRNHESVNNATIQYEVWIQEASINNTKAWILNTTTFTFKADFTEDATYFVWVRCLVNKNTGPFCGVLTC